MFRRYQTRNAVSFTMIMSFTTLGLAASGAHAEVITVDDDGKADFASIQAAVDYASDGDEILVAPGIYTSDHPAHVVDMLGKAITLRSSDGPDVTFIDGEDGRRGIVCFNGETSDTIIEGFTIRNGLGAWYDFNGNGEVDGFEDNGGGMYNSSSNPTMSNCIFENNSAPGFESSSGSGGGMYNGISSPTLTNCTFIGNSAGWGGGIFNTRESPTLANCSFMNNSATYGGGITNVILASPRLTDCTFQGNQASKGGGMYNFGDMTEPFLDNCTFINNKAIGESDSSEQGYGGGMHNDSGSIPVMNGCIFAGNSATTRSPYESGKGGGICIDRYSGSVLNDCTFENNSTDGRGGGIYCNESAVTISRSTFTGNFSDINGGGLFIWLSYDSVIDDCLFTQNSTGSEGGGIYHFSAGFQMNDTTLCGNGPGQINGLNGFYDKGGNCISLTCQDTDDDGLPDCIGNGQDDFLDVPDEYETIELAIDAAADAAVINIAAGTYLLAATLDTIGKAITLRGAVDPYGNPRTILDGQEDRRVLWCTSRETADTVFENLIITGGHTDAYGGGMYINNQSYPTLINCRFTRNSAAYGAGMIVLSGSDPTLIGCAFEENNAAWYGGGIGIFSNSHPTLSNNVLCGNAPDQIYGDWADKGGNTVADECSDDTCPADLDGNGSVDGADLTVVLGDWGLASSPADLNDDGLVDGADLTIVLAAWGSCP